MTLAETFMTYWIKLTWNKHKKYMKEYSLCHDITYNMIEFLKKYKYDVEIYKSALIETIGIFNRSADRMLIEFINNAEVLSRRVDERRGFIRSYNGLRLIKPFESMDKSACINLVEVIIANLEFCRDIILENKDKIHFEEYDNFYIYFSKNIRVLNEMKNDLYENNTKMNYLKLI